MSYDMDDRYGFEWCASTRHGVFRQSAVSLLYQLMIFDGIFHFSLTTAFTFAFRPFFGFLLALGLGLFAFAVQTSSLWVGFISGVNLRLLFAFFAILA